LGLPGRGLHARVRLAVVVHVARLTVRTLGFTVTPAVDPRLEAIANPVVTFWRLASFVADLLDAILAAPAVGAYGALCFATTAAVDVGFVAVLDFVEAGGRTLSVLAWR